MKKERDQQGGSCDQHLINCCSKPPLLWVKPITENAYIGAEA